MPMSIVFAKGVDEDCNTLTRDQEELATKFLKALSFGERTPSGSTEPMKGENFAGYSRWKPRGYRGASTSEFIRIVYKVQNDTVIVLAVRDRADVYMVAGKRVRQFA